LGMLMAFSHRNSRDSVIAERVVREQPSSVNLEAVQ